MRKSAAKAAAKAFFVNEKKKDHHSTMFATIGVLAALFYAVFMGTHAGIAIERTPEVTFKTLACCSKEFRTYVVDSVEQIRSGPTVLRFSSNVSLNTSEIFLKQYKSLRGVPCSLDQGCYLQSCFHQYGAEFLTSAEILYSHIDARLMHSWIRLHPEGEACMERRLLGTGVASSFAIACLATAVIVAMIGSFVMVPGEVSDDLKTVKCSQAMGSLLLLLATTLTGTGLVLGFMSSQAVILTNSPFLLTVWHRESTIPFLGLLVPTLFFAFIILLIVYWRFVCCSGNLEGRNIMDANQSDIGVTESMRLGADDKSEV